MECQVVPTGMTRGAKYSPVRVRAPAGGQDCSGAWHHARHGASNAAPSNIVWRPQWPVRLLTVFRLRMKRLYAPLSRCARPFFLMWSMRCGAISCCRSVRRSCRKTERAETGGVTPPVSAGQSRKCFGISNLKNLAAFRPRIFARVSSLRVVQVRSIDSAECGQVPS